MADEDEGDRPAQDTTPVANNLAANVPIRILIKLPILS